MPELPEVETIKRGLMKCIVGKTIQKVHILCEKSFRGDVKLIEGQKITAIDRRGKALLIKLSNKMTIMMHLRMTGQMIYEGEERFAAGHPDEGFHEKMPGRFTRVYAELDEGTLYFNDQRKFGFWAVLDELGVATDKFLNSLGPEPWDMKSDAFWEMLRPLVATVAARSARSPLSPLICVWRPLIRVVLAEILLVSDVSRLVIRP